MDKYAAAAEALISEAPAEEQPRARQVMLVVADTLRTFEQIAADVDRIATALEKIAEKIG